MTATCRARSGLVVRVAWGGVLLVRPQFTLRLLGATDPTPGADWVARALGARHLVDAALEARHGPRWRAAGGAVDGIHSVTAAAFALADRRWRRPALTDAAIAAAFALGAARRR